MNIITRKPLILICLFLLSTFIFSQTKKRQSQILTNQNLGKIEKLDVLNTQYLETNLSITPDGKYLYFETDRPSPWSTKNYGKEGKYDADIWYSKLINDEWQAAQNVGQVINSSQSEGEPNISPDGQTMYFQSWKTGWESNGGPYFRAELKGDKWVNPVGFSSGITEFFIEMNKKKLDAGSLGTMGTDGATFSSDGNKFIFSFGLNYYGNMDIYLSSKDSKGDWSKPVMLPISTEFNDRCPFLAADGKTLYFASNGYNGFGKLDIYKTTLNEDGTCGEVYNLGEPFNTKNDDYGFLITASGNYVYFVRDADIYRIDLKDAVTDIKPIHTIILSGIVKDSISEEPLEAKVSIIDLSTKKEVGTSRSNSSSGEYSIVLQGGKEYRQIVRKDGYELYSRLFETTNDLSINSINYDVLLKPIINKPNVVETPVEEKIECISKLLDKKFSIGINPAYPLAIGVKSEVNYSNFGGAINLMYLPSVGEYDDPKPPDNLMKDNYSTLFLLTINYNFPLFNCKFYPYVGLFTGIRTRTWKKPLDPKSSVIESGSYSDNPWGVTIGGKVFITDNIYIEAAAGIGKFAFHVIPSGDIIKYELKYIPWFLFCYMFD